MADRPRKSLAEKNIEETPTPSDASSKGWVGRLKEANFKQKAIDVSDKLRKSDNDGMKKSKPKKNSKLFGRSRAYVRDFFKGAPTGQIPALIWFLHPARQYKFWFNKNGALLGTKLILTGFAGLLLFGGLVYAYYSRELPDPKNLGALNQATKFYDRTGEHLLYSIYGDENRTVVEFDKISPHAKHAAVAIEDKNFYGHFGISPTGIVRASINNVFGQSTQGGSTITQQFVKNALLTRERSFERKVKEAILSLELERLYTKDEILGFYLNEIPYGGTAYGIEAAARSFFSKPASDLTIEEAAMLAALPQAPTYYSPYGENTDALIGRTHYIIGLMEEQGYITEEEAEAAKSVDLLAKINKDFRPYRNIQAPYLVLEAQRRLELQYGAQVVAISGWKVITTVDMDLQRKAEEAVAKNIAKIVSDGGDTAAIVATDPLTGQVLAAVGGADFNNPEYGRYNAAFTALRQPGSSIKPYTYATLMKGNAGAGTIFYDVRTDFGGNYVPENADDRHKGAMPMRSALAESRNVTAVKALYMAGLENVFQTWRDIGIVSSNLDPARHGLAFGLGTAEVKLAEHVNGYETFANGGLHRDQALWLKITKGEEVIDEWRDDGGKQVVDPQIAYIVSSILSDTNAKRPLLGSLGRFLEVPGVQLATKTGTTQSRRDAWTMGYSTCLAAGVWVGHHANQPMERYSILMAGPTFHDFMVSAHAGKQCKNFDRPAAVKDVTLDRHTGRLPDEATGGNRVTDIFPSWYKPAEASGTERFTIDIVSGKLATDCTPEGARRNVAVGGVDAEIPPSDVSYGRWSPPVKAWAASVGRTGGVGAKPTENDDAHSCSDAKPEINSFEIEPQPGGSYKLTANVTQGKFPLKTLDFKVDGQIKQSMSISSSGTYTYTYTGGGSTASTVLTDEGYYQVQKDKDMPDALGSSSGPLEIISPRENEDVGGPMTTTTNLAWRGGTPNFTVTVNGAAQPQCSGSARSCTITLPAGTGTYTATVTDGAGTSRSVTFKK